MRARVRDGAALLCAGYGAAFSLACGLTADFGNLQGGGTHEGPEASTQGPDASAQPDAPGASLDAPSTDGDAGVDGNEEAGFCASLATPVKLCTDFDEGQPVDAGWGATDLSTGGEAIALSTVAFSHPSSFLSSVNPSGAPASARLLETVPTQSAHVHFEFQMLLQPSDGTFELAVIHQVTADGTTYGLFYREVNDALQVQLRSLADDGTVFDQTWMIGAPPTDWVHVVIDEDVSDSATFTVQQNGAVVATADSVPTSTPSRTAMFVELGFYSFAPGTGQANFDNAIVDWP